MKLVTYWSNRLSHPIRGIIYGIRHDSAIQIEIFGGIVILSLLHYFFGPFSPLGQLLLIFSFLLILITEFQNSAVETALDRIHPERHHEIGRSKDLAAASVIWAGIFGLICLYFVLTGKI
tara:strand:- start:7111 stop:7470 length:360 start_codon:yes stop_codon:yes gene_type:complete